MAGKDEGDKASAGWGRVRRFGWVGGRFVDHGKQNQKTKDAEAEHDADPAERVEHPTEDALNQRRSERESDDGQPGGEAFDHVGLPVAGLGEYGAVEIDGGFAA